MSVACRGSVAALIAALIAMSALLAAGGCERAGSAGEASDPVPTTEVRVAAAADLEFALDEVIDAFRKENPAIAVPASYGSSGNFYAQLSNRAPFDIYFSADIEYPRRLADSGLALRGSLFEYAIGRIVVWVPTGSPIDVEALGIEALAHPSVRKIAIANPEHAPYGRAAEAAMRSLGIHERVKDRLVLGENIAQTAQFVESGAADAGILALSLAIAPAMKDKGTWWMVPADAHPAIEQGGVILSWAADPDAAQRFKAFVTGPDGRAILERYGFVPPGE